VARAERALRDAGPTITPLQLGAVALAQQLAVPVAGMAAPRDLLRQLAGIDLAAGADSSGAAGRAPPAPGPGAQPREASHTAADVPAGGRLSEAPGANGHASARQSQAPPVGSAPREPTAGPLPRGDGASHVALGAHVAEEQIERIAPPSLAPQLPPLLPPRLMGMPTLAVASEIARQGALAEATAGDDLDTLAAKIKHILDEEARRHGIDV
jgi:hypothetical protein